MKCLVIRLSSLGDLILTTPVVDSLAAARPGAEIHFAAFERFAPILARFPQKIIPHLFGGQRRAELIAWAEKLGVQKFDLVLDLHDNWRSRIIVRNLGAATVRTYPKEFWRRWRMVALKRGLDQPYPVVDRYLSTITAAGYPISTDVPRLIRLPEDRKQAVEELVPLGWPAGRPTIGIGWGAHWPTKKVPVELWDELIGDLKGRDNPAFILFAEEQDRAEVDEFIGTHGSADIFPFCGMSIEAVCGAMGLCAAFVSSDSGLMHASAALGLPTYGLYGPTHPSLGFAPRGDDTHVVHAGTFCSPCSRHGKAHCYRDHRYCFEQIDIDKLANQISGMLRRISDNR